MLANPIGTAAAPAYSFNGNANTGMYSPAANQVALSTNGTAALTVTANGFVGIGTTAPSTALMVNSGSNFMKVTPAWLAGTGTWIDLDTFGPSAIGSGGPGVNPWVAYTAASGNWFANSAVGDIVYRNSIGKRILLGIDNGGGTATPTITLASNSVGIGTMNPGAVLDVVGTGTTASAIIVPRDTTAMRPTNAVNGMIRYNTATAKFEAFENNAWANMIGGGSPSFPLLANPIGSVGGAGVLIHGRKRHGILRA